MSKSEPKRQGQDREAHFHPKRKLTEKEKRRSFIESHIEHNGLVQVMIKGVQGRSSLWKGSARGMVVAWVNNPLYLFKIIETLKKEVIEYSDVFCSLHKPQKDFKPARCNQCKVAGRGHLKYLKGEFITYYSYVMIDIDPICDERPVPYEYSRMCQQVCSSVKSYLLSCGFPKPVVLFTGNGCCVLFSTIGFKNTTEVKRLVEEFLRLLNSKFQTEHVQVDTVVGNSARSFRLPGTMNNKRSDGCARKARVCYVHSMPEKVQRLRLEDFKALLEKWGGTGGQVRPLPESNSSKDASGNWILDVEAYLSAYGQKVQGIKDGNDATIYCLEKCVFNEKHTGNDASIIQRHDGPLRYQCFHNSCKGRKWKEARSIISGDDDLSEYRTKPINESIKVQQGGKGSFTLIGADQILNFRSTTKPLIKGFLGEGEATLLVGSGGVGKSMLTLFIAFYCASVRAGKLLFGEFQIDEAFSWLIIQAENSEANTKPRIKQMLTKSPQFKKYTKEVMFLGRNGGCRVTGELTDVKFQQKLIAGIKQSGAKAIILDPLISFHNVNENENTGMRKELDALRSVMEQAEVSAIIVHHSGKGQGGAANDVRGAGSIFSWADNVIALKPGPPKGGQDTIKVICHKSRNYKKFRTFELEHSDMSFARVMKYTKDELVVQALKELGGHVLTQKDLMSKIAEIGTVSMTTAHRMIKEAESGGLIIHTLDGDSPGYRLP